MTFGIIKAFNPNSGMGVVASCGMDGEDLFFAVDPASVSFEIGQRVSFGLGKRAVNLRPDHSHIESETRL
jgi:cold shock CspA family protein